MRVSNFSITAGALLSLCFWTALPLLMVFAIAALRAPFFKNQYIIDTPGSNDVLWTDPIRLLPADTHWGIMLEMAVYIYFIIWLGNAFLDQYRNAKIIDPVHRAFSWLTGFVPGYLMIVSINRISTYLLPNSFAPYAIIAGAGALGYIARRKTASAGQKNEISTVNAVEANRKIAPAAVVFFMTLLFLIIQVQMPWGHVVADGAYFFLQVIKDKTAFSPETHFPLVSQHCDEILFLYPIIYINHWASVNNFINCYWMMYAINKEACFSIIWWSLHVLARSRIFAWLGTFWMFFGTLHPIPSESYLILDANSPLSINLHVSRLIMDAFPLAIVAIMIRRKDFLLPINKSNAIFLFLLGIGLSAAYIHCSYIVAISILIGVLTIIPASMVLSVWTIAFSLLTAMILFLPIGNPYLGALLLLLPLATASFMVLQAARRAIRILHKAEGNLYSLKYGLIGYGISLLGLAVGLLFLANWFVPATYNALHIKGSEIITRPFAAMTMAFGVLKLCAPLVVCELDLTKFARTYGLPFFLMGIAALIELRHRPARLPYSDSPHLLPALAICSATLVASLFVYNFTNGNDIYIVTAWTKVRLVEAWFYSTMALSLTIIWNRSGIKGRSGVSFFFILYIVAQVFTYNMGILGQIIANAKFLWSLL